MQIFIFGFVFFFFLLLLDHCFATSFVTVAISCDAIVIVHRLTSIVFYICMSIYIYILKKVSLVATELDDTGNEVKQNIKEKNTKTHR